MRQMLSVFALAACVGCSTSPRPPAEKTETVSNTGFKVEQLFTDSGGTTIYRFYDQGDWRYYASNPRGSVQMLPTTKIVTVTDTDSDTVFLDDHDHHHHGDGGHGDGGHGDSGHGGGGHK